MSENGIVKPDEWRCAAKFDRRKKARALQLPSGATVLAVPPEPLEWVLSGRVPSRLLGVALEGDAASELTREEVLELSRFAVRLVTASIVEPEIGDGPGQMPLDDIPIADRVFIFQWASRSMAPSQGAKEGADPSTDGLAGFREDASLPAGSVGGGEVRNPAERARGN